MFLFSTAMTLAKDYMSMLIVCALLVIAKGIRSVYMCIVIPSYIPLERLASASAIQLFGNGIVMLCIGPVLGLSPTMINPKRNKCDSFDSISGVIKDISGSYVGCVHFLNACTLITISMYLIELVYLRLRNKKCHQLNGS